MQLSQRQLALLAAVIERYVATAEPVGSATLASDVALRLQVGSVSSATIRNEMAELEAAGLLSHPHTSAGRIPTDFGYRVYVDELLKPRSVWPAERAQIDARLTAPSSVEDALREACTLLARLSGYPAVATLPEANRDSVRHVQINPLPPRRLMLALVTASGRIENRVFEVEGDIAPSHLATAVNFLNRELSGLSLNALRVLAFEEISGGLHGAGEIELARRAFAFVQSSATDLGDEKIVVQGLVTLLDEPEFSQISQARAAMRLFDDAATLGELLRAPLSQTLSERNAPLGGCAVVIGCEHTAQEDSAARRFSLVGIAYGVGGEVLGTVGVMGPTRMKYADAAALVPALAARLQSSLDTL
jgi:heat-inducible transcriptional repressor